MNDHGEQLPGRAFRHRYEGPFFRRMFVGGVRYMPRRIQEITMPFWAGMAYSLVGDARRNAAANLDRVLGPAPSLVRRMRTYRLFMNYAQALTDNYALQLGKRVPLTLTTTGRGHFLDAVNRKRGVIALTGHLGVWQFGALLADWGGLPPFYTAMAEEPNPLVQQFEERFRSWARPIYTTGSPFSSFQLIAALREGAIVGMQMDRHIGGKAVPVPFCGQDAWFAQGPALLSRITGAPMVLQFFVIEQHPSGRGRHIAHYVEPAIEVARTSDRDADVREATSALVHIYERFVKRYACQWYNFHDFWKPPDGNDAAARPASPSPGRALTS